MTPLLARTDPASTEKTNRYDKGRAGDTRAAHHPLGGSILDNAKTTETEVKLAGCPLPWDVIVPNDTGFLDVIDGDGAHVTTIDGSDQFWSKFIADANVAFTRIDNLERALLYLGRIAEYYATDSGSPLQARMDEILPKLGLAKRVSA